MSLKPGSAGKTRNCPHCRTTILESAAVCPSCRHHLRFDSKAGHERQGELALGIEGSFSHPPAGDPWEFMVVVTIRDGSGKELERKVVGVGALGPGEQRSVGLAVEVYKAGG